MTQTGLRLGPDSSQIAYRSDIDGLRAISVLAVILSHAGFSTFSGGFVGVDIFFVISGYLITTILLKQMANGTYTLADFYERRARRLLPALLLVILSTYPFAWILMLPDFLQNFGQSVVATLLFSNNILLAKTSGYWDLESNFKPLLHTWSLGVEEQFYIVFPLILSAIWRFKRHWQLTSIALIGIASIMAAEQGWRNSPAVSFYLPTTRAWELMAGCAAAYLRPSQHTLDDALSGLGLLGILSAVFLYDSSTPSPSLYMALPVLGTVLILLSSRPGTVAFRLLSIRPMIGIGLISYSVYLWHQPIMALTRVASIGPPSKWLMGALCLASIFLGWMSWRFVEVPFRSRQRVPLPIFAVLATSISATVVASGLYLHVEQGLPKRIFPNIDSGGDVYIDYNMRVHRYASTEFQPGVKQKVLIIGNIFARDIANVLVESGATANTDMVYLESDAKSIIHGRSTTYAATLVRDADVIMIGGISNDPTEVATELEALSKMTKARITTFGPKNFGWNLNPFGRVPVAQRSGVRSNVPLEVMAANESLKTRIMSLGFDYVDVIRLFGGDGKTVPVFDELGNPLSPDRIHLTKYGAIFLADRLRHERPDILDAVSVNASPEEGIFR